MGDRRQVHRREPIEVEIDDGRVFIARPLPWMVRNDLGSEILRQNTEAVNDAVRLYADPDTNIIQLEAKLQQKLNDPLAVLKIGFPDLDPEAFEGMTFSEIVDVILASLEVNQLDHLRALVDPNFQPPMPSGGTTSLAEGEDQNGEKIGSSVDSLFSASVGTPSLISPTEK